MHRALEESHERSQYEKGFTKKLHHALQVLDAKIALAKYAAVDTGAEIHIVDNQVKLVKSRNPRPGEYVISANNQRTMPSEVGDMLVKTVDPTTGKALPPLKVKNASRIPNAPMNLLSVSLLCEQDASFHFYKDRAFMEYQGRRFDLEKVGGLYLLRLDEIYGEEMVGALARSDPSWSERVQLPDGRIVGQGASLELHHQRLGMIDPRRIRFIFDNGLYDDLKIGDMKTPDKAVSNRVKAKRVHIDFRF